MTQEVFNLLIRTKTKQKLDIFLQELDLSKYIYGIWSGDDTRLIQSLNFLTDHIKKSRPLYMESYHKRMIEAVSLDSSMAYNRNILRYFHDITILDEDTEGQLYDLCNKVVLDTAYPIACRAFALKYCCVVVKKYPELHEELSLLLEVISEDESPGIQSCIRQGRKLLY